MRHRSVLSLAVFLLVVSLSWGQEYQPKYKGDPAKSDSEAAAIGFIRTIINAEKNYKARHNSYAPTLQTLAGTGSVTRRTVASNKRGDYTVGYKTEGEGFRLTMTPDHVDATHRSFFVDQSGRIKAEEDKPATAESPAA